jgi:hypothetical protein
VANRENMIKLTIDVDYPYPSRFKSFLHTAMNLKAGKDYLKNSRIIAQMINESKREVMAYWFFTPATTPKHDLLALLGENKHEVGLHVAKDPFKDLKVLEKVTKRKIDYYTVHGTERLLARIMWRHTVRGKKAHVPKDFPLKYIYEQPPVELDVLCYNNPTEQVVKLAEKKVVDGEVLHIHPEWLFQRGTINHRGPVYEALKKVLLVDEEFDSLAIRKKRFAKIARDVGEYQRDLNPTDGFIEKLMDRGIDIFSFVERKWCCTIPKPNEKWAKTEDNIALLKITTFDHWWESIGKKTRNMVRKAEKNSVRTEIAEPNQKLAEGIWKINNETPIRQERAFPHYGISLGEVKNIVSSVKDGTFIGAFIGDELMGFIQLGYGDKIAIIQQILSFQKHSDKAVNNALIAKAVEVCTSRQVGWLMYGRIGNHPSLDSFKENNGFTKFSLSRYYVPLTRKGRIAMRMGLHKEFKDSLPEALKSPLFPVFNWVSRTKQRMQLRLFSKQ